MIHLREDLNRREMGQADVGIFGRIRCQYYIHFCSSKYTLAIVIYIIRQKLTMTNRESIYSVLTRLLLDGSSPPSSSFLRFLPSAAPQARTFFNFLLIALSAAKS